MSVFMTDHILYATHKEEALSRAYVEAVAASAGYTTAVRNLDVDGVDLQINAGGLMRPCLDLQLKATINLGVASDGQYRYPLKRRNYDLLRLPTVVPRILVLLSLPPDESQWMSVTPEELVIRKCAYWVSLQGYRETDNTTSVTITVPEQNRFDVAALQRLMDGARNRNGAV